MLKSFTGICTKEVHIPVNCNSMICCTTEVDNTQVYVHIVEDTFLWHINYWSSQLEEEQETIKSRMEEYFNHCDVDEP